jgi:hypothetical protein
MKNVNSEIKSLKSLIEHEKIASCEIRYALLVPTSFSQTDPEAIDEYWTHKIILRPPIVQERFIKDFLRSITDEDLTKTTEQFLLGFGIVFFPVGGGNSSPSTQARIRSIV